MQKVKQTVLVQQDLEEGTKKLEVTLGHANNRKDEVQKIIKREKNIGVLESSVDFEEGITKHTTIQP